MKKILYMMMAAALLAACDNPLEYKPESKADELVLNAHLSADEQWHTVYVAVSHTERWRPTASRPATNRSCRTLPP